MTSHLHEVMRDLQEEAYAGHSASKIIKIPPLKTYTAGDLRFMDFTP